MANELAVLESQLKPLLPHLQQALADRMPAERLMRTILVSVERQPKLLQCTRQSVLNSSMTAAFLGLEVDGVTGQAYLVPFRDKRQGLISQLLVGYQGYNTLGARSGYTITAEVVREGDDFDFGFGSSPFIRHKPALRSDGRIIAAWACASSRTLPPIPCVLPIADVIAIKERSKAAGGEGGFSPWDDPKIGFPAMAAKSARRRLRRSMPLNALTRDYHMAACVDEAFEERGLASSIRQDGALMIAGTESPIAEREPSTTPTVQEVIGPKPDREIEAVKAEGREAAEGGTQVLSTWWGRLSGRQQKAIAPSVRSLSVLKPDEVEIVLKAIGGHLG